MTHAELLRSHANLAIKEGGMYYSGEYLSGIATVAESLEAENARLRELCGEMLCNIHGCTFHHSCGSCDFDECIYETRARELGIEMDE